MTEFGGVPAPGSGGWQRAIQALEQQIAAAKRCEFPVFTRLTEHPALGRDISAFRRTDTTTFQSWYAAGASDSIAASTLAVAANTLYVFPHVFTAGYRIKALAIETTAGDAAGRVGIWEAADDLSGNPLPTRLLYDSGSIDTSGIGVLTVTLDLDVEPGRVYAFGFESSGTPTMRALVRAAFPPVLGWPVTLGANANYGYTVAHTFGALPDPFTTTATGYSANTAPAVFMRLTGDGLYEHQRTIPAWAPPDGGYVLRRAKLLWAGDTFPVQETSFLSVRAGIRDGDLFSSLGSFDTRTLGVVEAGVAYPLTGGADVDAAIEADQALEVRLIQAGYPRVPCADAVVQWDVARVGTG